MVRAVRISPAHLILTTALGLSMAACSGDDGGLDAGPADGGGTCAMDEDCPEGQTCDVPNAVCVADSACAMDEDCGDGRTCDTAASPPACVPAACAGHSDCGAWVCIGGTCAEPPSCAEAACPEDLVCNADDVCEAPTACADDSECTSPQICAGGVCRDAVSCTDSTQCESGLVCQQGTCDDACAMDAECGDPNMFTCETSTGLCRQRCLSDDNCGFGFICEELVCLPAECTVDSECTGNNEECQGEEMGHGRCVEVFSCTMDSECPDNFTCENMTCVELPACIVDRDCGPMAYCEDRHCQPAEACNNGSCPSGFDCVGEVCVPGLCRGPSDCPNMGEICIAGECVAAPVPSTVTDVRILTPAGAVGFGETYAFTAVALDAAGDIVPGVRFDWSSTDTNVATIDAAGVATAGNAAGQTGVVASVDTGAMTVASSSVALTVFDAAMGFRVTVVSERSGAALAGVTVVCNGDTQTTDASGVAMFDSTTPKTCSAFDASYDYVTVFDLTGGGAHLSLPPRSYSDRSTGFTGSVDTSFATSPVKLSFTGGSFAAPLFAFTPANLLGGDVFSFDLPVVGTIAFPSGATARAEFMGIPLDLKGTYYARAPAGLRRAWTLAGGAEIADLGLGGGGGAGLLENLLPLFQTFRHGGSTGLETLVDLPYVPDTGDINGNGDTTEMVPDYNGFVPKNLTPTRQQNLRFVIDGTGVSLPMGANAIMMVGGVNLPTVGFVPLGLDGLSDPASVGRFTTAMAAPYDGLEAGEYVVLVAAVTISSTELPEISSTRILTAPSLPGVVDITAGFLPMPTASFDGGARTLDVPAVNGADAWHAAFVGTTGGWQVFGAGATAALPEVPMGFEDRSAMGSIRVEALDLVAGETFDGLFRLGVNAEEMDRRVAGFSQQRVR